MTNDGAAAEAAGDVWLDDVWTLYFHDPDDARWTLQSYERLADLSTLADYWDVHVPLLPLVPSGMFFLMRESIFPCWDDPANIDGGCVSIKVPADEVREAWDHLARRLLGETLARPVVGAGGSAADDGAAALLVNGLSVSPKRNFCVIKIWLSDGRLDEAAERGAIRAHLAIPPSYTGDVVYRRNRENIQMDAAKSAVVAGGGRQQPAANAVPPADLSTRRRAI